MEVTALQATIAQLKLETAELKLNLSQQTLSTTKAEASAAEWEARHALERGAYVTVAEKASSEKKASIRAVKQKSLP